MLNVTYLWFKVFNVLGLLINKLEYIEVLFLSFDKIFNKLFHIRYPSGLLNVWESLFIGQNFLMAEGFQVLKDIADNSHLNFILMQLDRIARFIWILSLHQIILIFLNPL